MILTNVQIEDNATLKYVHMSDDLIKLSHIRQPDQIFKYQIIKQYVR